MARARVRPNKSLAAISDIILAEWYRVLPEDPGGQTLAMDPFALTTAFNQILLDPCQVILDEENQPFKIVVPLPPVTHRAELDTYLQNNVDFRGTMGVALVFGCGK
jgi:hypothetical protein